MLLVGCVGYNAYGREGLHFRKFAKITDTIIRDSKNKLEDFLDPACQARYPLAHYCKLTSDKPATVAIIGDSHANHFFYGLSKQYGLRGENLVNLGLPACVPLVNVNSIGYWHDNKCSLVFSDLFKKVANDRSIHTVILAAQWHNQIIGTHFYKNSPQKDNELESPLFPKGTSSSIIFEKQLQETINYFQEHHKKIILIKQIPELDFDPIGCVISKYRRIFSGGRDCVSNAGEVTAYLAQYEIFFDRVASQNPEIKVWNPQPFFVMKESVSPPSMEILYMMVTTIFQG